MKRIILILLTALTLGAIAFGGYMWSQREAITHSHPLEAVMPDALLVIEFQGISEAVRPLMGSEYGEMLLTSDILSPPLIRLMLLDSVMRPYAELGKLSGLHAVSSQKDGLLTVLQVPYELRPKDLRELLGSISGMQPAGEQSLNRWTHDETGLIVAAINGLIIMADSETAVDAAIYNLLQSNGLWYDFRFMQVRNSSGKNVQLNLYLRLTDQLIGQQSLWRQVGDWLVLDVTTRAEGPVMNGFAHNADSTAHLINLFRDCPPQPMRFTAAMPADVSAFMMFAVKDMAKWHRRLNRNNGAMSSMLDSLNLALNLDIAAYFTPWMSGQFGSCRLPRRDGSVIHYAIMGSSNNELADQLLLSLSERTGGDTNVRSISSEKVLQVILGPITPALQTPHFVRVDDHIIFGNSQEELSIYVHHLRADRTLATDISFAAFSEQFSSSFNVFSFQKLPFEAARLHSGLTPQGESILTDISRLFSQFPAFGVQFSNAGGTFYVNMHWRYDPNWQSRPAEEAAARTDAPVTMRPVWVRNHLSGEPELLVQDRDNTLYLFNRTGQELFKRNLPESIVGRPVQVDRFKNGNLQYVFSTNNFIYQIDRNGKDVEGFPVELESPVSAPMLVVDYDNKRNYRLLVPSRNLRMYNYGIDGKKVKGWKFDRTATEAGTSMAYLSHNRRDHLSIVETGGKAHLLDRAGGRRGNVKDSVSRSANTKLFPFSPKDVNKSGFYLSDPEGTINHITLNGEVRLISLGRFTADHRYWLADLDADGSPEHIFLDINTLKVFSADKELLFKRRVPPESSGPAVQTAPDGRQFIALSDSDNNQLLLLDATGNNMDGFPLGGNGPFDVWFGDHGKISVAESTTTGLRISTIE